MNLIDKTALKVRVFEKTGIKIDDSDPGFAVAVMAEVLLMNAGTQLMKDMEDATSRTVSDINATARKANNYRDSSLVDTIASMVMGGLILSAVFAFGMLGGSHLAAAVQLGSLTWAVVFSEVRWGIGIGLAAPVMMSIGFIFAESWYAVAIGATGLLSLVAMLVKLWMF